MKRYMIVMDTTKVKVTMEVEVMTDEIKKKFDEWIKEK